MVLCVKFQRKLTPSTSMKSHPKVLFLGYNTKQTHLIGELMADGCEIWHCNRMVTCTEYFDIAISFGYQYIIPRNILENEKCPIINLHISFLPFNRGAHPNFWSFYEQTPSGVTIHQVDDGIDTGDIICQKEIEFDNGETTFIDTYNRLRCEVEMLFLEWKNEIISKNYTTTPQDSNIATFHKEADLPQNFSGWDSVISTEITRLHNSKYGLK